MQKRAAAGRVSEVSGRATQGSVKASEASARPPGDRESGGSRGLTARSAPGPAGGIARGGAGGLDRQGDAGVRMENGRRREIREIEMVSETMALRGQAARQE